MTLPEWADTFRVLSRESSSEPGPWDTSRVEPARGPMLAATDPAVHTVTLQCATQTMKTELINNVVGYYVHLDPCPIMVMQPTEKMAAAWSKDRLEKMVRDTPVLQDLVAEKKSREGSNTIYHKEFPGGHVTMVGANAPSDLAMRPIRILLCDEVDKYPVSAGKEGDPIKLAAERTATFWNAKKIFVCSPTVEGRSRIASEYDQSDKRIYEMPCPHCDVFQEMMWNQVRWEHDDAATAAYYCEQCGEAWSEVERLRAIRRGRWRATAPFKGHAGFRVSKLASPWEPLSRLVEKFLDAKKDPEKLKVFVNTQLAETWKEKGDAPDWERLYDRREPYKVGTVPDGVVFLTAGVDIQENRIEVEVVGWGRDKQSWSIEVLIFDGPTATAGDAPGDVWRKLGAILNSAWHDAGGTAYSIQVMAVDSGYRTQTVYNWARQFPMNRVIAVKGSDRQPILINSGTFVDVRKSNRTMRRGFKVFSVGVGVAKSELYGWLRLPSPLPDEPALPGYCHFPEYEAEFFKQLTAETIMKKVVNGHPVYHWEKTRERNEALDRRVYARVAASYYGIDRFREEHWEHLASHKVKSSPKVETVAPKVRTLKRRPSEFMA